MLYHKLCSKCGLEKPVKEFYPRPNGRFASRCKNCSKLSVRKYEQSEKGKIAKRKYNSSKKGRAANARYDQSEKRKVDKIRKKKNPAETRRAFT